ncbi:unknown [Salmonella phage FelixO1]|uniref:Uncharacterized protein n=1 Tax=Salmonella phage Felix O1 (isolate Felix O1-VT1) TaxID=1283336 RepID=Q6KGR4_BPFO1|nr:unknown [Salmonella phage FelixO1]
MLCNVSSGADDVITLIRLTVKRAFKIANSRLLIAIFKFSNLGFSGKALYLGLTLQTFKPHVKHFILSAVFYLLL